MSMWNPLVEWAFHSDQGKWIPSRLSSMINPSSVERRVDICQLSLISLDLSLSVGIPTERVLVSIFFLSSSAFSLLYHFSFTFLTGV